MYKFMKRKSMPRVDLRGETPHRAAGLIIWRLLRGVLLAVVPFAGMIAVGALIVHYPVGFFQVLMPTVVVAFLYAIGTDV